MNKAYVSPSELTRSILARLRNTYRVYLFLSGTPDAPRLLERCVHIYIPGNNKYIGPNYD